MHSRSFPARRTPLAISVGLAAFGLVAALHTLPAWAAAVPEVISDVRLIGDSAVLGTDPFLVDGGTLVSSVARLTLGNHFSLMGSGLTVDGDNQLTLSGAISGSGPLIKTGSGTLDLFSVNTYTGGTLLRSGTLYVAQPGGLGSGTLTVTGNGMLQTFTRSLDNNIVVQGQLNLVNARPLALTGRLSGNGTLLKQDFGTLELHQDNDFSGAIELHWGRINVEGRNGLGNGASLLVGLTGKLQLNASANVGSLSGDGLVSIAGGNTLIVGSDHRTTTFSGTLQGAGNLVKNGYGVLTLSGNNSLTGTVDVNDAGRLRVNGRLDSNLLRINDGGSLDGNGTLAGELLVRSGGYVALYPDTTLSVGSLVVEQGGAINAVLARPSTKAMLDVAGNLVLAGTLNVFDDGSLGNGVHRLIDYAGTLTDNGFSLGSLPTSVVSGTVQLQTSVAGQVNVIVNAPGLDLQFWDGASTVANGAIEGGAGVWNAYTTSWTRYDGAGNSQWGGKSAVFQGVGGDVVVMGKHDVQFIQFTGDGYALVRGIGSLNLVNDSSGRSEIRVDDGISSRIDMPIHGGRLEKTGGGTLILSNPGNDNDYSGGTLLSAGRLQLRNGARLGSGTLVAAGGTTLANEHTLALNNQIQLAGELTIDNMNVGTLLTLTGNIEGAGGLHKTGGGILDLMGQNSYQGGTRVSGGSLLLRSSMALGRGTLTLGDGTRMENRVATTLDNQVILDGTQVLDTTSDLTLNGVISGTTALTKTGRGTLRLNGDNRFDGTLRVGTGTLVVGHDNALGHASLHMAGISDLQAGAASVTLGNDLRIDGYTTVSGSRNLTLNGNLSGTAALTKYGSGRLTLGGESRLSEIELNSGTLALASTGALGTSSLSVANGTLVNDLALSLDNAIAVKGALNLNGNQDLVLTGALSGSGMLTVSGDRHVTIGNSLGFSGGWGVRSGTLSLLPGSSSQLGQMNVDGVLELPGSTRILQLGGGGVVKLKADTTVSSGYFYGALEGEVILSKDGFGTLTLAGDNNLTHRVQVGSGRLVLDGSLGSAAVQVNTGATLAGSGLAAGAVTVVGGGRLGLQSGQTLSLGSLSLDDNSTLLAYLGAPVADAPGLVNVAGNLTLGGWLDIVDDGGFALGVYRLFDYGGVLTDNGLRFVSLPVGVAASEIQVQTSVAGQVNLVVGSGDQVRFWGGGAGIWNSDTASWGASDGTANSVWNDSFAVFQGSPGTVTVEGAQRTTGLQFLTSGYQLLGSAGASLEVLAGGDGSQAPIRVADGATTLLGVPLIGDGGIDKRDNGTLVLAGLNSYSGGTTVSAGTLRGNSGSLQGAILNNASLVFQQDSDATFAGTLSGTGNTFKRGYGRLLLTGYNDFSGNFTVEDGVLQVGETAEVPPPVASFARMALFAAPLGDVLDAAVVVNSGAGLSGTGTVASVVNHGTVQPGPNGNLTVSGDFTNASDGTLSINLTPLPTRYLAVGGSANLAGRLNLFAAAPYAGDTTYTLLTADGGISGTFDSDNIGSLGVASNLAFIDTTLSYGSNEVSLSVARNGVAFADVALSDNQRGVAVALDSAAAPASLRSAITSMDVTSAQAAFDGLSGEIHASTASVLLDDSRYLRNTVNDRMRQGDCGNGDPRSVLAPASGQQSSNGCQGQGVGWMTALGGWANHDGGSGVASVDRDLSGFMLGFDNNLDEQWRAGIAAGYSKTSLDANRRGSDASVDSYHLATYLSYQLDAFAARMGAGYSWHDIDSKRNVVVGNEREELKAKYKAGSAQVFGEVGYTVEAAGVALEPFAGIAYVNYDSDTGREKGGAGALEASSKQDATFTTVGLRAGKRFVLDNGTSITPRGSLGWRHAFGDTTPDADLRFVDGGAAFSSQGVPLAKDAAVLEAGLDISVGAAGKLGIGYSGQLASEQRDHALTVSFSMGF